MIIDRITVLNKREDPDPGGLKCYGLETLDAFHFSDFCLKNCTLLYWYQTCTDIKDMWVICKNVSPTAPSPTTTHLIACIS
jgi:hypothetical protein